MPASCGDPCSSKCDGVRLFSATFCSEKSSRKELKPFCAMKASKSLTESERKVVSKEVQTITDNFVSQVGDMSKAKEADL